MASAGVAINPVECNVAVVILGESDVPLFAIPSLSVFRGVFCCGLFGPPIAGRTPGSCRPQDLPPQLVAIRIAGQRRQLGGTSLRKLHPDLASRTNDAQSNWRKVRGICRCKTTVPGAGLFPRNEAF